MQIKYHPPVSDEERKRQGDEKREISKKSREFKNKVNPLVEKAFGEEMWGNYDGSGRPEGELNMIGKSKLVSLRWIGPEMGDYKREYSLEEYIGRFKFPGDANGPKVIDGSEIFVAEKYLDKAKIYAELYEKEFGKDVTIFVDDEPFVY